MTTDTVSIKAAHADERHEMDPYFALICAECRIRWVDEVASLLRDRDGDEHDLANMDAEEYSDAAEASAQAKWELGMLSHTWGEDAYNRMVGAAVLVNRVRRTVLTLF